MSTPSEPFGSDADLDRLLAAMAAPTPEVTPDSQALAGLAALLAAAAAPSTDGPQPGEAQALAAFRELVTEAAGTPSLAARRTRLRVAVVTAGSTLALLGGGVAAAATGSLPGPAQTAAHDVLGTVGVHVPNDHAGQHPYQRGHSGKPKTHQPGTADQVTPTPSTVPTSATEPTHPATPTHPAHPSHPAHPTTGASGHPTTLATPGNSGVSRHHGNPTPAATVHPSPGHGKPKAAPAVSRRHTNGHSNEEFGHVAVTHSVRRSINH